MGENQYSHLFSEETTRRICLILDLNWDFLNDLGRPFHIRALVLANRSLSFSLVSEQGKTKKGHFRMWQREKWNESHPLPALSLTPFLARSLTLDPRCLLWNQTETLATQASFSFPLKSMVWCHQEEFLWKQMEGKNAHGSTRGSSIMRQLESARLPGGNSAYKRGGDALRTF